MSIARCAATRLSCDRSRICDSRPGRTSIARNATGASVGISRNGSCEHRALLRGQPRRGTAAERAPIEPAGCHPLDYDRVVSHIRDAVAGASSYLTEHPDEARYRDSHARARLSDGLRVEVDGPGGEHVITDMPRGIGGGAAAPGPGWYFRAAAASCVAALIGIRSATTGLDLPADTVTVTVDSESDDRGILGLDDAIPAGVLSLRVSVSVAEVSVDRAAFEAVVRWAVDHCPVIDTARRGVPIEVELA